MKIKTYIAFDDDQLVRWLVVNLITMVVIGQHIFTSLAIILNLETTIFSIIYRIICLVLAILPIGIIIKHGKYPKKLSISTILFIIFAGIYFLRFINDTLFKNISFGGGNFIFIYSIFIGTIILPCLTLILTFRYISTKEVVLSFYKIIKLTATLVLIALAVNSIRAGGGLQGILFRTFIQHSNFNVISLSLLGEITITLFLAKILLIDNKKRLWDFIYLLLGIVLLIAGASRSPMLGTFINMIIISALYLFKGTKFYFQRIIILSISTILLSFILIYVYQQLEARGVSISAIERLSTSIEKRENGGIEIRDLQYESAIQQFGNNPIFGDQYVDNYANFYPHNLFLEILMATGIIGFIPFILSFLLILKSITKLFLQNKSTFSIIFSLLLLTQIVTTMFSGGIFLNGPLWILFIFLSLKRL